MSSATCGPRSPASPRPLLRLGQTPPSISVGVRSGDTSAGDRRKIVSRPPDILITTPESLFLMLTSAARDVLRHVETVIVDEVHALAGTKRGAHLALSLERLDALVAEQAESEAGSATNGKSPRPFQRIGLSATVRPPERVARYLGGAHPVTVVAPPASKSWDLSVVVPVEDMGDLASTASTPTLDLDSDGAPPPRPSIWPHVENKILDLISAHHSTIVFANSRRLAERLTAHLNELQAERDEEAHAAEQPVDGDSAGTTDSGPTPQPAIPHRPRSWRSRGRAPATTAARGRASSPGPTTVR